MDNTFKCEKVFVAVHGVGDQYSYETIQAVARQVYKHRGFTGALPLGWLYSDLKIDPTDPVAKGLLRYKSVCRQGAPAPCDDKKCNFDPKYGCVSFPEVYWAGIPRSAARGGYVIEETKKWAKTIVERLRAREKRKKGDKPVLSREQYRTIKEVLTEMVSTVRTVESLVGWLSRYTKFSFSLNKVLDDYVNDVQAVAEYRQFRDQILVEFDRVMQEIHEQNKKAEIYLIAHSEGTVVSFLGLLRALSRPVASGSDWVENVRGFMTLGSPIDKHLILWPELWREFEPEGNPQGEPVKWRELKEDDGAARRIPWYNYYDFGDPVGFDLETARDWMNNKGGNPPIDFSEQNDIGFSRYVFPGKAHTDYWRDGRVFAHFFEHVVMKDELGRDPIPVPRSKRMVRLLSATLPYLLVIALCSAGTYFLYEATAGAAGIDPSKADLVRNVAALGLSLALATAAARIPRLTHANRWRFISVILLVLSVLAVSFLPAAYLLNAVSMDSPHPAAPLMILNGGIALVGWLSGVKRPKWGMIPMMATGIGGVALAIIFPILALTTKVPLWPVIIAGIGFVYFWWLAALLFDLSFVWHRYCQSALNFDPPSASNFDPPQSVVFSC